MSSIPKVFNTRKKTQTDIESEHFERNQYGHISKAINSTEGAPKEKHVRGIILGTFHYSGALIFLKHSNIQNLLGCPISCWKFLYVIYKIMRDGHDQALKDIIKNERYVKELHDLWCHLKSGYGPIISTFCKLLYQKMKFHKNYPNVSGGLIDDDTFSAGKTNDELYELSLDILNYLEELVKFEQSVVNSLDKSKSNSMTPQGQCRLTPLILVIQEMATLYDISVRLLFKLHSKLDVDLLSGHRQIFFSLFESIKSFFSLAQTYQYFKTLIQVPTLAENPPNFFVESDLVAQKALVVNVNVVENNETNNPDSPTEKNDTLINFEEIKTNQRFDQIFGEMNAFNFSDNEKTQMQNEIDYLKKFIDKIKAEYSEKVNSLLARIRVLEEEVKGLVQLKDQYEEKIRVYEAHKCDSMSADKFNKLKDVYAKLREDHVKLLRIHGEAKLKIDNQDLDIKNLEMNIKNKEDAISELEKKNLLYTAYEKDRDECQKELVEVQSKLSACERSKYEYLAKTKNLETRSKELELEIQKLQMESEQMKEEDKTNVFKLEIDMEQIRKKLEEQENLNQIHVSKIKNLEGNLEKERLLNDKMKFIYDNLIKIACQSSRNIICTTYNEISSDTNFTDCKIQPELVVKIVEKTIQEVGLINEQISQQFSQEVKIELLKSINNFGHLISECLYQGHMFNDESAEVITSDVLESVFKQSTSLLDSISNDETSFSSSNNLMHQLQLMIEKLKLFQQNQSDESNDKFDDLFDEEFQNTKRAIELAEERFNAILEETRSKFSGVQLEVNEKILDSCCELMYVIKVLIEKSRTVQNEIVKEGKGSGSLKDFYKKHHKWTEGLISAAKSVGAGAFWLCEAGDNLITKNGKFEDLIVCSREITASTAQLVVSSRVKAKPTSPNLTNLLNASKDVSTATGKVIANAKNAVTVLKEEEGALEYSGLSLTQARRLEMNSQVKVLELESELEKERKKLGEIRKMHYQLAGEDED